MGDGQYQMDPEKNKLYFSGESDWRLVLSEFRVRGLVTMNPRVGYDHYV